MTAFLPSVVHSARMPSSSKCVTARENYVQTHFLVKDNGIGMSEDFQKKIFESFSREESEQVQNVVGTGLGMAITKSIVDLMGGRCIFNRI